MKIINKVKSLLLSKYPKSPRLTYSYDCEDLILEKIINYKNGFFVDVGAHDPIKHSNTFLLYKKGWSGINIDANPLAIKKFTDKRKNCINLNMGVSDKEGSFKFYVSENPLLSSFDKTKVEEAENKWNFSFKEKIIKTYRLESILDQYLESDIKIDLLNIDVEGLELEILKSNNWEKYAPSIIVVELHERYVEDVLNSELYQFLKAKNYKLISKTFITLIFERIK